MVRKKGRTKTHRKPSIGIGLLVFVVSMLTVLVIFQKVAYVASGNIYVTPPKAAIHKDDEVRAVIRITPNTPIDTVTATVQYDEDAFTYKTASYSGSPFSSQIPAIVKGTTITVQSAKFGGSTVDDDALVATLTFVAKKDNAAMPKITYGNAAHAGLATDPTVEGQVVSEATNPFRAPSTSDATQTNSAAKTVSVNEASSASSTPLARLLMGVGMDRETANRASSWVVNSTMVIVIAALGYMGWFWHKKSRRKNQKKGATV